MTPTNAQRKHIAKLKQKKFRDTHGQFVVEGAKGVHMCLQAGMTIEWLIVDESQQDNELIASCLQQATTQGREILFCKKSVGEQITATDSWPGILAVVKKPKETPIAGESILVLDSIADPGNLGTIIRTADWFGIHDILLGPGSVDPFNPKVVRSSMGSICTVSLHTCDDLAKRITELKQDGYAALGFNMTGESMQGIAKKIKSMYIFGSESHGIQPDISALCDAHYSIEKGSGTAESLNVGIAAGIVLHHIHTL